MESSDPQQTSPAPNRQSEPESVSITENDIVFNCPKCSGELVVDREGGGMQVDCSHCGAEVTVPHYSGPPSLQRSPKGGARSMTDFSGQSEEELREKLKVLELQYKENGSQRTEMRGHINRAQIDLHRMQLRLQKLVERQQGMEGDIQAIRSILNKTPAAGE